MASDHSTESGLLWIKLDIKYILHEFPYWICMTE